MNFFVAKEKELNPPNALLARLSARKHNRLPLKVLLTPFISTDTPWCVNVLRSLTKGESYQDHVSLSQAAQHKQQGLLLL